MDQEQTSSSSWFNTSSHTPKLSRTAMSVELAVAVDSINFASMISLTAPAITGTVLGLPLSSSVATLTDTTSILVTSSLSEVVATSTSDNTQRATTTITRSVSAFQSVTTTDSSTWRTSVTTAGQIGISSITALPSHLTVTGSTSTATAAAIGPTTTEPVAVSGTGFSTSSKVTLIVATVIPGCALIIAAIWLFWFWLKKKRQREKILDDLERTAIWVSTSNRSPLIDAQIASAQTPEDIIPTRDVVVNDSNSPSTIRTVESEHAKSEEINYAEDNNEGNSSAVSIASVQSAVSDPFNTPTSQPDSETIRASQIGLAITTSMYSNLAGSASTIIRHASRRISNPFSTPPPPVPARLISTNSSTSDVSAVIINASTPPPTGIEPPANSLRTPYLHASQPRPNGNTSSVSPSNDCLHLGHHVCDDASDCPLTHLMYAKVIDMGRRTNNIVEE